MRLNWSRHEVLVGSIGLLLFEPINRNCYRNAWCLSAIIILLIKTKVFASRWVWTNSIELTINDVEPLSKQHEILQALSFEWATKISLRINLSSKCEIILLISRRNDCKLFHDYYLAVLSPCDEISFHDNTQPVIDRLEICILSAFC